MKTAHIRMEEHNTLYDLAKWVIAWVSGTVGTLWSVNKVVDSWFKYKATQQAKFIEDVVDRKVTPEISELKTAIDELREVIWELKKQVAAK